MCAAAIVLLVEDLVQRAGPRTLRQFCGRTGAYCGRFA